jgi:hypothetical protein
MGGVNELAELDMYRPTLNILNDPTQIDPDIEPDHPIEHFNPD